MICQDPATPDWLASLAGPERRGNETSHSCFSPWLTSFVFIYSDTDELSQLGASAPRYYETAWSGILSNCECDEKPMFGKMYFYEYDGKPQIIS